MKEVKIKLSINNSLIEKNGFLKENILLLDNDSENITYILKENILIKEGFDNIIKLDFNNSKLNCYLKEINQSFIMDIDVKSKVIKDNKINIIYEIESNIFRLDIEYEVI